MIRRHPYECAVESFLRSRRIPYVAVDEARRALLPVSCAGPVEQGSRGESNPDNLKSFDFVVYAPTGNLLVDVKGRRLPPGPADDSKARPRPRRLAWSQLQSWVTEEDIRSLTEWERLFGHGFEAMFLFVYRCDHQPPDAVFSETIEFRGQWYGFRTVSLSVYRRMMKPRSARWQTVFLPSAFFEQVARPLMSAIGASDRRLQAC